MLSIHRIDNPTHGMLDAECGACIPISAMFPSCLDWPRTDGAFLASFPPFRITRTHTFECWGWGIVREMCTLRSSDGVYWCSLCVIEIWILLQSRAKGVCAEKFIRIKSLWLVRKWFLELVEWGRPNFPYSLLLVFNRSRLGCCQYVPYICRCRPLCKIEQIIDVRTTFLFSLGRPNNPSITGLGYWFPLARPKTLKYSRTRTHWTVHCYLCLCWLLVAFLPRTHTYRHHCHEQMPVRAQIKLKRNHNFESKLCRT